MLHKSPRNRASLKDLRDDYRCIATGAIYTQYYRAHRGEIGEHNSSIKLLRCCRIFPGLTNSSLHKIVCTVLEGPGFTQLVEELAKENISTALKNVFMVESVDLCDCFDTLELWFEPVTGVPNRYRFASIHPLEAIGIRKEFITFHSSNPRLPSPSSEYLSIHAACCRIAHLSGASDHLYELEEHCC
ncbi:hypothetical protein BD310DRAFT_368473 [Dichomitus squalens]|uniref:HNH nuclease domain-containing protein n=1 Tax=Dichomitus squalens TaxID=114155 RepID=A0A4Q9PYT4_9APHY|nr:hypothetical protein BD310DRAFT_368473 [Dichomitus squalens]